MGRDPEQRGGAAAGGGRLPPRAEPDAIVRARDRLLARVVPGGLAADEAPSAARVGRYTLLRRLGQGGMGEVFEAADPQGRHVALKRMRHLVAQHEPTRRRFLREARTAAAVHHPGVVEILDVGEDEDGLPFLVMELVDGTHLDALVERDGPLPWDQARPLLLQIAQALDHAHARGVIHRDLKPSNVMILAGGDRCKLIDFGLARRELLGSGTQSLSRTGEILGSPPFMSPEQFRGADVDARADQYAFGCLMHVVLTGRRPFPGSDVAELMYQHLFVTVPPPQDLAVPAELAPAVRAILLRCMRKDPADRFPDMAAVCAAMKRLSSDPRPVHVPPDRGLPRGGRHRSRLLLWALPLAAGAAGAALWISRGPAPATASPAAAGPSAPAAASPVAPRGASPPAPRDAEAPATQTARALPPGPGTSSPSTGEASGPAQSPTQAQATPDEPAARTRPRRPRRSRRKPEPVPEDTEAARVEPSPAPPGQGPSKKATTPPRPRPTTELPPNPFGSPSRDTP